MMMFISGLLFMIPLSFFSCFWFINCVLFWLSFFFLFHFNISWMLKSISYYYGLDLLSFILVLLSFWICSLMIMASEKINSTHNYENFFIFMVLILLLSLYLAFSSLNFFVFYLFFETSLIPTLILVIGWGYQPERINAGVYLLFYTLSVSLPMIVSLFLLYDMFNSLDFCKLVNQVDNIFIYFSVTFAFLVKMPMFLIHLWLPKAHVEAPISGSMILAGVMLKLGGYGLFRTMKMFQEVGMKFNDCFIVISLWGGVIISLMCIRQSDMKSLIAYSSVIHMGLVLSGILTLNLWGFWGGLLMMVAHGLCSSGLFCLANISYERVGSRSLYLNKGMMNLLPNLSFWWFMFCVANMAAPPSLNLLGEILLMVSLVSYSKFTVLFIMIISFMSAVYSLFLYSFTQHGAYYSGLYSFYPVKQREYLLLFLHWFPLNMFIFKSEVLTCWI